MQTYKIVLFAVGILVLAALALITRISGAGGTHVTSLSAIQPGTSWSTGPADAKVTLVEYADFECPACGAYYPIIKKLQTDFGSQVKFVYRNFPLWEIHPNAMLAAQAAEAAGAQGKFWEMHDKLFETQASWASSANPASVFEDYAAGLGLDVQKFTADMNSAAVKQRVEQDRASGEASGVNSTPSFFLNGQKIVNPQDYDEFKFVISQALGPQM